MKSFDEIYNQIYNSFHTDLEIIRKKQKNILITAILIVIILFPSIILLLLGYNSQIPLLNMLVVILMISAIILIILSMFNKNKFNKIYKENVISKLVEGYDSNLKYDQKLRITSGTYKQAEFESYNNYHSDDLIYGNLDGKIKIQIGDVRTEMETTDSEGNSSTVVLFRGLFSQANLNQNIGTVIKIRSDKGKLEKLLSKKSLMQMDSQVFEKEFDVFAQDKIIAMRILTSDILDYMITFKNENNVNFELTLKDQELYIRIHCQNMFESTSIFKDSIDKTALEKYYNYLNFICELNRKFYYTIEEKNI